MGTAFRNRKLQVSATLSAAFSSTFLNVFLIEMYNYEGEASVGAGQWALLAGACKDDFVVISLNRTSVQHFLQRDVKRRTTLTGPAIVLALQGVLNMVELLHCPKF